jgi:adenine-specific DNA-methyltransferase
VARRRKSGNVDPATDPVTGYRYDAQRKNIPSAGLAAQGRVAETTKERYSYDPHLPPELRFDATGGADALPELLAEATRRPLTETEARAVLMGLRQHQPWLEWSGKREARGFVVDPVALHIHERVSAQAILKMAKREDVQRDLFADPEQPYREAVQFYQHDVDWANRLILGDSLQVMASLVKREELAGKVQMIYLDPPYGIRFASNFQSEIGKRDVKDKESDLTREPEMIKAYRDTWTLGVHSYLAYLRDRLMLCRELLTDSGSIFVQISDENLHRVRSVMDDVFGAENYAGLIAFSATTGQTSDRLAQITDYLLWYAKELPSIRFNEIYELRPAIDDPDERYVCVETPAGQVIDLTRAQKEGRQPIPSGRILKLADPTSQTGNDSTRRPFEAFGMVFRPTGSRGWSTNWESGLPRVLAAGYLHRQGESMWWKSYRDRGRLTKTSSLWLDTRTNAFGDKKRFVVQTPAAAIQRCLLMATDPGDLVLDPTCGSGTTAYIAEQWGRRWITIDSSRVALAIARQRLLTSKFDQYRTKPPKTDNGRAHKEGDPANGFIYKTVPHVTLKSIAQNTALDPVVACHEPILDSKLAKLNAALKKTSPDLRRRLATKLAEKEKREGKRAVTDADRRRWLLPNSDWNDWQVPFDADDEWPTPLASALADYRAAWRAKMNEVDAAIAANAEPEELVDQPEVVPGIVRVSGPFTVEAVMPAEESIDDSPVDQLDEDLESFGPSSPAADAFNGEAYVDRMRRLLVADGVRFPDNKVAKIARLDPLDEPYLHAEGEWSVGNGKLRRVAVSFGPQHGPVTAVQVEEALHAASRRGFDDVIFAGFNFDGAAQAVIQDDPNPRVRSHLAHIRPDVQMGGLLKDTPSSQLFTVFGTPRTTLERSRDGSFTLTMEGVDIYDPVANTIVPTRADKVAAWFLDTDYDGRTFCITQAFFPDKSAWEKLSRALKGYVDEDKFAALSGTTSLPFEPGKHARCAVKVIDPRGNEVMRVHRLQPATKQRAAAH